MIYFLFHTANYSHIHASPLSLHRFATDMASWLSSTVMAKYADYDGLVSFDAFANWWLDGGSEVAPWLELLDLSKWVLTSGPE